MQAKGITAVIWLLTKSSAWFSFAQTSIGYKIHKGIINKITAIKYNNVIIFP